MNLESLEQSLKDLTKQFHAAPSWRTFHVSPIVP